MNTPAHAAISVALFGRQARPDVTKWIILGSIAPDLVMFPLFFFDLLSGYSPDQIFNTNYFTPRWQNPIDLTNSSPIFLFLLAMGLLRSWKGLIGFSAAALTHITFDFPLHGEDAHRHFFPISDYRFESPVSYWDPNYYGDIVGLVEIGLLFIALYFAWRVFEKRRNAIIFTAIILLTSLPNMVFTFGFWLGIFKGFD